VLSGLSASGELSPTSVIWLSEVVSSTVTTGAWIAGVAT
jgi:hypothetical protein